MGRNMHRRTWFAIVALLVFPVGLFGQDNPKYAFSLLSCGRGSPPSIGDEPPAIPNTRTRWAIAPFGKRFATTLQSCAVCVANLTKC
jgi:hypothetical protein